MSERAGDERPGRAMSERAGERSDRWPSGPTDERIAVQDLRGLVRDIPDFPQPGVVFKVSRASKFPQWWPDNSPGLWCLGVGVWRRGGAARRAVELRRGVAVADPPGGLIGSSGRVWLRIEAL